MARYATCVSVLLLSLASRANAQVADPRIMAAGGLPPSIAVVDGIQDGKLILRHLQIRQVTETHRVPVSKRVIIDGREHTETEYKDESVTVMKTVSSPYACDLADVRAFDTDAQPISIERFGTMFMRPRMVLLTFAGYPVDPAYLKLAKDSTPFLAIYTEPPSTASAVVPTTVTPVVVEPAPPTPPATVEVLKPVR